MKRILKSIILILIAGTTFNAVSQAQTKTSGAWTKAKSAKWFNSHQWLNGSKVKPHETINQIAFAEAYHKNKAMWDKIFTFLKNNDLEKLAPGKYPIDGENAFANISEYVPRELADTKWEAHRKYIDFQMMIQGKEKMGIVPLTKVQAGPYNDNKDVANFSSNLGKYYIAQPGTFLLFFPSDGHRPNIKSIAGSTDKVKKIVIKIKAE